jgi:hypothetical protein
VFIELHRTPLIVLLLSTVNPSELMVVILLPATWNEWLIPPFEVNPEPETDKARLFPSPGEIESVDEVPALR